MTKALIIGIDGAPYTLLGHYVQKGILPNIKRILSGGFGLNQMDASIPDVSSTSWTSFMTGVNPGEHGIYGFMELRPGTYKMSFPNSNDITAPVIWEMLDGESQKQSSLSQRFSGRLKKQRSIALNIPQTFPARPMNGILTAGFVCPDFKKGTYPDSAYEYLRSIGYMPDIEAQKAVAKPDEFFSDAFLALRKRAEAFDHLMKNEEWGLFIGVITETDRLHHFFFDAAMDEDHKYYERFVKFYSEMDKAIGGLFDRFMEISGGKGLFMTMSDHGFTVIKKEVYLNQWLKEKGLLNLNPGREYFEQIDAGTRAFAMDPSRIYLNIEGKYPLGCVKSSDKVAMIGEIKKELASLKDTDGSAVVKEIFEGDALYKGNSAQKAPDIVCLANDGYDFKGNLKQGGVFGNSHFRGMHTRHDAHCIMPEGVKIAKRLHIEDLAPIILEKFTDF